MKPVPYSGECRNCERDMTFTLTEYPKGHVPNYVHVRCKECDTISSLQSES